MLVTVVCVCDRSTPRIGLREVRRDRLSTEPGRQAISKARGVRLDCLSVRVLHRVSDFAGSDRSGGFVDCGASTYALLHEVTELSLILDLDKLLAAIGRVGDVQLHLGGIGWSAGR